MVDIDKPDFETYPALQLAKGYSTILETGDTLYMPSGYWHHIEYVEGGFGLSVRTLGASFGTIMQGLWNVSLQRKFDDIMFKLRGQKWFNYKKQLAIKRGEKAMQKFKGAVLQ